MFPSVAKQADALFETISKRIVDRSAILEPVSECCVPLFMAPCTGRSYFASYYRNRGSSFTRRPRLMCCYKDGVLCWSGCRHCYLGSDCIRLMFDMELNQLMRLSSERWWMANLPLRWNAGMVEEVAIVSIVGT